MLAHSSSPGTTLARASFACRPQTSKPSSRQAILCQADRRRNYGRGDGRFTDDVSSVMDVVADVLAGAETIYAASKRTRDEAEQTNWANSKQSYSETTAAPKSNGAEDGDEEVKENFQPRSEAVQAVPVDIEEHAEGYTLYMDVPGLQKSDVKVQVYPAQRKVTISGERSRVTKDETDPSGRPYRRRFERNMGKFSRTLKLAKDLDVKSVSARVDHGVLIVNAKKVAPLEPEAMEIDID